MKMVKRAWSTWVAGLLGFVMALSLALPPPLWASQPHSPSYQTAPQARPLSAPADNRPDYVPGELLVRLKDQGAAKPDAGTVSLGSPQLAQMLACFQLGEATQVAPSTYKLRSAEGPGLNMQAAADALESTGAVSYAGPNHLYYIDATPNDQQYVAGQQWGLTQIKAEQAWDVTTGSPNIVIAVIDTGTAVNHPDLQSKIVQGHDFVNNDNDPSDDNGHGTHVSGIAAANSNNGQGIAGVSWGARVMPVKVLSGRGGGSTDVIAQGIHWAVDNGARIINLSLGGPDDDPVLKDAVQYAFDRNVLVVAAAGNTPDGLPHYPAAYGNVLAVGATGRADTFTGFSSFGSYVGVSAPGVGIWSTWWDNGNLTYESLNGTSQASPFVAGTAALVWSANPSLNAQQVRQIIEDSSDDLGDPGLDAHYGYGRINAFRAVQMAQQGPPTPRTPTAVPQPTSPASTPNIPIPTATSAIGQVPTLQVDASEVAAGGVLTISGAGFAPNELVSLGFLASDGNTRDLGSAQTSPQGDFRAQAALPNGLASGKGALTAIGALSTRRASLDLTIKGGTGGNGGQSAIKGVVRGANLTGAVITLKPAEGTPGSGMTAQAGAGGAFTLSNLAAGSYSLSVTAFGFLPAGPYNVQLDGTAADVKSVDITLSASRPPAFEKLAPIAGNPQLAYFSPVGHTLKGPFLQYWQAHGGLAIFGYPLSEEFPEVSATDGKTYTVQYFERNRFEYHPEFANTPNEVLMGLLGVDVTKGRTFAPGAPFQSDKTRAYFNETHHSLTGPFLQYWQAHGGLAIFGYPISEQLTENGYTVQYFERNRFEYHPEFAGTSNEVLLGLLGVEVVKRNGWMSQ